MCISAHENTHWGHSEGGALCSTDLINHMKPRLQQRIEEDKHDVSSQDLSGSQHAQEDRFSQGNHGVHECDNAYPATAEPASAKVS